MHRRQAGFKNNFVSNIKDIHTANNQEYKQRRALQLKCEKTNYLKIIFCFILFVFILLIFFKFFNETMCLL
jgi:hypothetical protein